jgi:hypothetical protein
VSNAETNNRHVGIAKLDYGNRKKFKNLSVDCAGEQMCLLDPDSILADFPLDQKFQSCFKKRHRKICTNGLTADPDNCGIHLQLNGTDAIYSAQLPLKKETIKWQCTYPVDQLEKPAAQRNVTKLVVPESSGSGAFRMSFSLFEDEKYSIPMSKTPNLHKDGLLRARIFLLNSINLATVQLNRCWATPFADSTIEPFDLIDNFCPLENNGAQTRIVNSGTSSYATFESGVFKFEKSDSVYLHCHVKLCFKDCQIDCSDGARRNRRSMDISSSSDRTISLGPISVDDAFLNIEQNLEHPRLPRKRTHISGVILDDGTIHVPPAVLWTLILTLIASTGALAIILLKWLKEDEKSVPTFIQRSPSIHTENTENSTT